MILGHFYLFITGKNFIKKLANERPYTILFIDGNYENFTLLNQYPVEEWIGGRVHIISKNNEGIPKIIHMMRGQVFSIEKKKIFTFGGGFSIDKYRRVENESWWPEEMPSDFEFSGAIVNLQTHSNKVDYIITHAAPEDTMSMFHPYHQDEKKLNNFLECE